MFVMPSQEVSLATHLQHFSLLPVLMFSLLIIRDISPILGTHWDIVCSPEERLLLAIA